MSGPSPWSVKGIALQERELVKQAARRAGVPIGAWLTQRIREAAQNGGRQTERAPFAEAPEQDVSAGRFGFGPGQWRQAEQAIQAGHLAPQGGPALTPWRTGLVDNQRPNYHEAPPPPAVTASRAAAPSVDPRRLNDLEQRVTELRARDGELTALRKKLAMTVGLDTKIADLAERLDALAQRIEALDTRLEARSSAMDSRVETLTDSLRALEERPVGDGSDTDSGPTTAPIERAVMRLSERLQRVEEITLPSANSGGGFFSRLFRRR
ncbi:MAG: hypothetical protein HQ481_12765 [Alphaproteobacteria bacterium]|nr:hypothetical protein [Alphaproteobacteria bacterium]